MISVYYQIRGNTFIFMFRGDFYGVLSTKSKPYHQIVSQIVIFEMSKLINQSQSSVPNGSHYSSYITEHQNQKYATFRKINLRSFLFDQLTSI
jgi:hypothetical protein